MADGPATTVAAEGGLAAQTRAVVMAAEMRSGVLLSLVGAAAMVAALVFVGHTFGPLVRPAYLLTGWLAAMTLLLLVFALLAGLFVLRKPGDPQVGSWRRAGAAISVGVSVVMAISPWILLPNASPALLHLMVLLYVWYLTTAVMSANAAVPISAFQVIMVAGSLVTFLLWRDVELARPLAVFLVLIAASMLVLRDLGRRAVIRAIEERLVSERAGAATRTALAAAAAERDAKTRLIAAASHDMQQPLQAASLFFENALEAPDADARERAVAGARRAFASTRQLIAQMLDHLRLEAGVIVPEMQTVNLGSLIAEVVEAHAPSAQVEGLRLTAMPSRVYVEADVALLNRALGNLVANAIRHSGGRRVVVGARLNGGIASLWVVDDGKGVTDADDRRLFDDFAPGPSRDVEQRPGFHLGLASARRSLALMGGETGIDRRWRRGSAFYLRLGRGAVRRAEADRGQLCAAA